MAMNIQAFEALVRTQQAELYRYLRYLGARRDSIEDLVQDVFLAVYDRPGPLAGDLAPRRAAAYLRGVARNKFLMHCRRARVNPVAISGDLLNAREEAWTTEFLQDGDGFEYLEALRVCLEHLPGKSRAALDMQYARRSSRAEMATALSLSEDGVKSLMRRIRDALGACVEKRLGLSGGRTL